MADAPLVLRIAAHSEVGLVRKNNQDSGYASPRLLLVADGMGGAAAGDLASAVAVQTVRAVDGGAGSEPTLQDLAEAIGAANAQLAELIAADYRLEGMGTTVTAALFDGHQLGLAHIGDSRAYLLRDDRLERLTHDHSWVQSLVDDGKISEAEASVHPHRSLLLRVLNGQTSSEPDLTTVPVQAGDRLLFCSDGLCGLVEDAEIAAGLAVPDLDQALARLVDDALAAGGIDNITAVLAEVRPAGEDTVVIADGDVVTEPVTAGGPVTALLGAAAERDVASAVADARASSEADAADEDDEDDEPGPADDDEERYRPQPPRRRRIGRRLVTLLVVLLVLASGLGAGYAWSRTQFYVGATGGQVTIFRGVADPLPGVSLSQVFEIQEVPVADLPAYYQRMVDAGIEVADLGTARSTVAELDRQAQRCRRERELGSRGPSGNPSSTPSGSATPGSPTPTPRTPSPTSPSPTQTPVATEACR